MEDIKKVKELEKGVECKVVGKFYKQEGQDKKGRVFYNIKVVDDTGAVYGKAVEDTELYETVKALDNETEVTAVVCIKSTDKYKLAEFKNLQILATEYDELINKVNEIEHTELKKLCLKIIEREDVKKGLMISPATQKSGYSQKRGLLKHILRMIELSKILATFINENSNIKINKDILIFASIIHDLGKIRSLSASESSIDKTKEGVLFDDTYLSVKILLEEINNVDLSIEEKTMLEHIIGSSKEQTSYGALFIPRTIEAIIFSIIEKLDTQIANFEFMIEKSDGQTLYQMFQKMYCLDTFTMFSQMKQDAVAKDTNSEDEIEKEAVGN